MRFEVICDNKSCIQEGSKIWIRGSFDPETNAVELDENDSNWNEGCSHIGIGDYTIGESEPIED